MSFVLNELETCVSFFQYDVWTTIVPGMLAASSGIEAWQGSFYDIIVKLLKAWTYIWLYATTFTMSNQIYGINEDAINKPFRPLVTGRLTIQDAIVRWRFYTVWFLCMGAFLGVLPECLLWIGLTIIYNVYGGSKWWWFRSLFIGLGTWAQLAAQYKITHHDLSPIKRLWFANISVMFAILIHIQDFRDVEGDKLESRKTLPILLGTWNAKLLMSIFLICAIIFNHYVLYPLVGQDSFSAYENIANLLFMLITYRLLRFHDKESDQQTYRCLELWFTVMLLETVWFKLE